eukprot:TRINITY_DN4324_c0_g1_i10.p1 TRINITY_DN4324_c0_g1~~TRINITY_DN4324_c0_g1_i10.p1  ORF type:complete len:378 (-),score=75.45 TRINITY_DN4324_c0_g1_i10:230-1363(-)
MKLRVLNHIPVHIEEDHNEVLKHIYKNIGAKYLPLENNTLVHFDSHPDLLIPKDLKPDECYDKYLLFDKISIENWILPGVFAGLFSTIIWVCPPWSNQIKPGVYNFTIGCDKKNGSLGVSCLESYYISEGLYKPQTKLDREREIRLIVLRLDENIQHLDLKDCIQNVKDQIDEVEHFILDIDLDFYSTLNPFVDLYKDANLYAQLKELYTYQPIPEHLEVGEKIRLGEEYGEARQTMLQSLESIFTFLSQNESLDRYEGPGEEYLPKVSRIVESVGKHYPRADIDWIQVHNAGSTFDDSELPHHISSKQEMMALLSSTEKLLDYLAKSPTVITVARSSQDDYCPPFQVEEIQSSVLSLLQMKYPNVKIHFNYQEDEE